MRKYQVTFTGKTPLLMHQDNIEWADYMEEWKNNPDNKRLSKAGDDRTPPWRWLGSVYHDGKIVVIPQDNIMRCLMEAGAMVPVPGGRSGKTFKSQTQSGMMSIDQFWPVLIDGSTIQWSSIEAMRTLDKFSDHKKSVADIGFDLMIKRAKIGQSKHIRVRPKFDSGWVCTGQLAVWDEQITTEILNTILEYAGQYKGLCDWRPGGKTPGPYGTFEASLKEV